MPVLRNTLEGVADPEEQVLGISYMFKVADEVKLVPDSLRDDILNNNRY